MEKIKHIRVSTSVKFFENKWKKKYNLISLNIKDINTPVFMVGLYNNEDYAFIKRHKGKILLRWCGTDALKLTSEKAAVIKSYKNIKHISISKFIDVSLNKFGIEHVGLPLTASSIDINAHELGDSIYFYGVHKAYSVHLLSDIKNKIKNINIIQTMHNTYNYDQLLEIYKKCFIGLRLTKHDGLPNTVIELGLMGRKCIYNGGLPHSIKWHGVDDICENIMKEYENRQNANYKQVSKDFKDYLDVGDDWLQI